MSLSRLVRAMPLSSRTWPNSPCQGSRSSTSSVGASRPPTWLRCGLCRSRRRRLHHETRVRRAVKLRHRAAQLRPRCGPAVHGPPDWRCYLSPANSSIVTLAAGATFCAPANCHKRIRPQRLDYGALAPPQVSGSRIFGQAGKRDRSERPGHEAVAAPHRHPPMLLFAMIV